MKKVIHVCWEREAFFLRKAKLGPLLIKAEDDF